MPILQREHTDARKSPLGLALRSEMSQSRQATTGVLCTKEWSSQMRALHLSHTASWCLISSKGMNEGMQACLVGIFRHRKWSCPERLHGGAAVMPAGPHLSPVVGGGGQAELLHHERQVDGHVRDQLVLGPEGLPSSGLP